MSTDYQLIHTSPGLKVYARPALGRWVVKWRWVGRTDRYGVWLPGQGWNPREWQPALAVVLLEAIGGVEDWLRCHPVPVPGAVKS